MAVDTAVERRIDAYLVCAGKYHDFDFARLELLKLLAEDDHIRVQVAEDFADVEAIAGSAFLVTYTCDVRPSVEEQQAIRAWVEHGGRWLALHGTNCALEPPSGDGGGLYTTPRVFPLWAETLGSQFISHPPLHAYPVHRSPGADDDPLVAGIEPFDTGDDEEEPPAASPKRSGPTTTRGSSCTGDRSATARSSIARSATAAATGTWSIRRTTAPAGRRSIAAPGSCRSSTRSCGGGSRGPRTPPLWRSAVRDGRSAR